MRYRTLFFSFYNTELDSVVFTAAETSFLLPVQHDVLDKHPLFFTITQLTSSFKFWAVLLQEFSLEISFFSLNQLPWKKSFFIVSANSSSHPILVHPCMKYISHVWGAPLTQRGVNGFSFYELTSDWTQYWLYSVSQSPVAMLQIFLYSAAIVLINSLLNLLL